MRISEMSESQIKAKLSIIDDHSMKAEGFFKKIGKYVDLVFGNENKKSLKM